MGCAYLSNLHIAQGFIMLLPIWHFSHWRRVFTYRLCLPPDCAPQGEVFLSSVHAPPSSQCSVGHWRWICMFFISPICAQTHTLEVLLPSENARNGLRIEKHQGLLNFTTRTTTYRSAVSAQDKRPPGAPSQPMLLLPSTLARALHPEAVSI